MSKRGAPFVIVRTDVRKEERILVIADIGGYSRQEALGRLVELWCWCADRKLEDAPEDSDGYAVPEAVVRRFLGPRGVEAILGDGCDELALGVRRPDGLIYLRETSDTVRGLRGWARTAAAGGHARAEAVARAGAAGRVGGRFVSETTNDQQCYQPSASRPPPDDQPSASGGPAVTSVDPRSIIQDPDPESEIPAKRSRACRLAPDWMPERSDANVNAEDEAKARGVDLRVELAKLRDWAKGSGARRADWQAVWRNWTRNPWPPSRLSTMTTSVGHGALIPSHTSAGSHVAVDARHSVSLP